MPVLPYGAACFLRTSTRQPAGGSRGLTTLCALALAALAWSAWLAQAKAEDKSVVAAANAYAQAQQAELKGDLDRAAELFELADRIAPTPEALRSATRARMAAGQLALAADNAEALLARYETDPASRELAEQVLVSAKPQLTRYTFLCSEPCTVVVDEIATAVTPAKTQVLYVVPGGHDVELGFGENSIQRIELMGSKGEARTIKVARPRAPVAAVAATPRELESADAPPPRPSGLSPKYFWTAATLTVVAGGLALWSGLDLLNARDDYKDHPTRAKFNDGESKDLRTSLLLGATGALAVTTATLSAFTRFGRIGRTGDARARAPTDAHAQQVRRDDTRPRAAVSFDGRGAQLQLSGRF